MADGACGDTYTIIKQQPRVAVGRYPSTDGQTQCGYMYQVYIQYGANALFLNNQCQKRNCCPTTWPVSGHGNKSFNVTLPVPKKFAPVFLGGTLIGH